jgi:hypothetical protein
MSRIFEKIPLYPKQNPVRNQLIPDPQLPQSWNRNKTPLIRNIAARTPLSAPLFSGPGQAAAAKTASSPPVTTSKK